MLTNLQHMTSQANGRLTVNDGVVIAGGGLAAQRCAETLRRCGYDEPIRMLCAEPHHPYDRPPLSKGLLAKGGDAAGLAFREAGWYQTHGIDLLCGVAATRLLPAERRVETSAGSVLRYRRILIATGGDPRVLPNLTGYDNVSTLRTVDDAIALRETVVSGARLVIVGAGFVGLELAATARGLGADVTVVEAAATPLASVLGERVGDWFAGLHREHGVRLLGGRTVTRVGSRGRIARELHLSDGATIAADQVVVGIGTSAAVDWLADSGLELRAGVAVDPCGRTPAPEIFAAGDVAATFDPISGRHVAGSHWEAAARQGASAARLMLGLEPDELPPASFWTDQYGLRIQYVGRSGPSDALTIEGDPDRHDFTATYTRAGHVTAVLLVNRPRALPAARSLIEKEQQ